MYTTNPKLPSYARPERIAIKDQLELIDDLIAGTPRMHARRTTYIRKWADEKPEVYNIRSVIENCFEGTGRTLSAATGMLCSPAPSITWNSSETLMLPHWQNIDASGTAGPVFVKRYADKSIRDGLGVILVDHTPSPKGVRVHSGNETELGLRPTWAMYERSQVLSWREEVINGRRTLTQLVLYECGQNIDGAYGMKVVHQYRVLQLLPPASEGAQRMARWTLYDLVDADKPEEEGSYRVNSFGFFKNRKGAVADFLPVAVAYTGRTEAAFCASFPLLGVAYANLAHYQQSTNLRFYRDLCAFPQLTIKGQLIGEVLADGTQLPPAVRAGPMVVMHLSENGDAQWNELTGSSMEQLAKGISESLSQMGQMGLAFLVPQTRMAETAEAKRIDSVAQNSTLSTAGQAIEDAVNLALEYHAWYLGIEKQGAPTLAITKEFEKPVMDAQMLIAWATASEKSGIPLEWMLKDMQAKGLLPVDADLERIAADAAIDLSARRRQKELEAQARLAGAGASAGDEEDGGEPGTKVA